MTTPLWITKLGWSYLATLLAYKNLESLPCARQRARCLPPSPLAPPRWTCPSACSPARPSLWTPSLTPTRASTVTYGLAPPHIPPGTSPPRRRRGCLAAGHHRAVLRPSHRHQPNPSESNRSPRSLVCVPWPHLARRARPLPSGYCWEGRGHICELGTWLWWSLTKFCFNSVQWIEKYL
jgi:hypothetical protein